MITYSIYSKCFHDEDEARSTLERIRWPSGPTCPHCGGFDRQSKLTGKGHRPGLQFCGHCRKQYTVTVGTVFERSKVPLFKWLAATYLMCSSKKGVSALQLQRTLNVTYVTAWFMAHRLREAMTETGNTKLGKGGAPVEVDETYWGNRGKQRKGARGFDHKMKILSLVERGASKRSFHVPKVNAETLKPLLVKEVSKSARLMTDEAQVYKTIGKSFKEHGIVRHSAHEYARGDVTTNTVECSFAILKRGLYGIYHQVGEQHLQRYVNEFDFKWNTRESLGFDDSARTNVALKGIGGKRLMYRDAR